MRSKRAPKRIISADPVFGSPAVGRLINKMMREGKKTIAQTLVYKAFEQIKEKSGQDPVLVFEKAVANVSPKMEVRPRRVGGASYQVPSEVRGDRKESLALRWILASAKAKPNSQFHTFDQKLAQEILDASQGTGGAVKKKDDVQRTANANRAFAHFRW